MQLPPVAESKPDMRLRKVHYDWLDAGEHTQRTVAQLSAQLRRFLDDKAWLENKRIMEILRDIKAHAKATVQQPPQELGICMDEMKVDFVLPMERPLYQPPLKAVIDTVTLEVGADDSDATALFSQVVVDKARLRQALAQALQTHTQIALPELLQAHPLQYGLAELVTWLQIASEQTRCMIDEEKRDMVMWHTDEGWQRQADVPHVLFVR